MTSHESIESTNGPEKSEHPSNDTNLLLKGIGVSAGIGIGQVIVLDRLTEDVYPQRLIREDEIQTEIQRFESAVDQAQNQLMEIKAPSPHPW